MRKARAKKWENETNTPTYNSWRSMRNRVLFNSSESHLFYKEKGITICDEWAESFDAFVRDMGIRPDGTTLDRIDPDGNYELENCRWVTMRVQQNNKHGLTKVTKDGETKTIGEWCYQLGLSPSEMATVYKRHSAYGAKTYEELFCANLYSHRKSKEERECIICQTKESTKWRKSACANCYARALRYARKNGEKVDIEGYARLGRKPDQ